MSYNKRISREDLATALENVLEHFSQDGLGGYEVEIVGEDEEEVIAKIGSSLVDAIDQAECVLAEVDYDEEDANYDDEEDDEEDPLFLPYDLG